MFYPPVSGSGDTSAAEVSARASATCPLCQKSKDVGALTCWQCFKYGTPSGYVPLKNSGESFCDWLMHASRPRASSGKHWSGYAANRTEDHGDGSYTVTI